MVGQEMRKELTWTNHSSAPLNPPVGRRLRAEVATRGANEPLGRSGGSAGATLCRRDVTVARH